MSRAHHVGSDDTLQFEHDLLSGHEAGVRPAGEGLLSCTGCSIHLILTRATDGSQLVPTAIWQAHLCSTWDTRHHLLSCRVVIIDPLVSLRVHKLATNQQFHSRLHTHTQNRS